MLQRQDDFESSLAAGKVFFVVHTTALRLEQERHPAKKGKSRTDVDIG